MAWQLHKKRMPDGTTRNVFRILFFLFTMIPRGPEKKKKECHNWEHDNTEHCTTKKKKKKGGVQDFGNRYLEQRSGLSCSKHNINNWQTNERRVDWNECSNNTCTVIELKKKKKQQNAESRSDMAQNVVFPSSFLHNSRKCISLVCGSMRSGIIHLKCCPIEFFFSSDNNKQKPHWYTHIKKGRHVQSLRMTVRWV